MVRAGEQELTDVAAGFAAHELAWSPDASALLLSDYNKFCCMAAVRDAAS